MSRYNSLQLVGEMPRRDLYHFLAYDDSKLFGSVCISPDKVEPGDGRDDWALPRLRSCASMT